MPGGHAYSRTVMPAESGFVALPDPHPDLDGQVAGTRWWPPRMLTPEWVERSDFDLMHVHFGVEQVPLSTLEQTVRALRETGRPLVQTVHDLENPHLHDQAGYEARLSVLVEAADAVLTLTPGAAAEIERRWNRRAVVARHPHLVPLPMMRAVREARTAAVPAGRPVVGTTLKDLRAGTDAVGLLPALRHLARAMPEADVCVWLHERTWRDPADDRARRACRALAEAADDGVRLVVHPPMDDDALWSHLASLDVAVLPYRHGTHSGWLEACHDLGTSVVAPAVGHLADQGPEGVYRWRPDGADEASLLDAVRGALALRAESLPGADADARARQAAEVRAVHAQVYAELLARGIAERWPDTGASTSGRREGAA
ncbi:glycosyltransferase family 1 protein [Arthrobacter sp. NEB 688]|uniref:glycosyltransferase family 1 protein n=1 Tax=Arthrobacter sp. NEB 688 TaxID=904039 RepID=UPI0015634E5B|nr:glycosyltransferase family 1 protein [Arthrobacter sp. NEB 688]QKE85738.1 glycosyltransferase family 1 protein [Arthrobacter sp. NEB 688]